MNPPPRDPDEELYFEVGPFGEAPPLEDPFSGRGLLTDGDSLTGTTDDIEIEVTEDLIVEPPEAERLRADLHRAIAERDAIRLAAARLLEQTRAALETAAELAVLIR